MVKIKTHIIYRTELKNIMERFIQQQIKDRTECFDDHFPSIKDGCNMQHVWNLLRMFLLYLHMETDRIKFTNFLINTVKLTEPCSTAKDI